MTDRDKAEEIVLNLQREYGWIDGAHVLRDGIEQALREARQEVKNRTTIKSCSCEAYKKEIEQLKRDKKKS